MKFIPRLDVNFLHTTQIVDEQTDGRTDERTNGRKVEPLYRTLLNAGAIKMTWITINFGGIELKFLFCNQKNHFTRIL